MPEPGLGSETTEELKRGSEKLLFCGRIGGGMGKESDELATMN